MKNLPTRSNSRIIYLSIGSMLLGVLFIDIYGIIIKFLGDTYSTNQVVLFRNLFAIISNVFGLYPNHLSSCKSTATLLRTASEVET